MSETDPLIDPLTLQEFEEIKTRWENSPADDRSLDVIALIAEVERLREVQARWISTSPGPGYFTTPNR